MCFIIIITITINRRDAVINLGEGVSCQNFLSLCRLFVFSPRCCEREIKQ